MVRAAPSQTCCVRSGSWSNLLPAGFLLVKPSARGAPPGQAWSAQVCFHSRSAVFKAAPARTCCPQGCSWSMLLCSGLVVKRIAPRADPVITCCAQGLLLVKPAALKAAPACCARGCSWSTLLFSGQLLVKPGLLKLAPTRSFLFSRLLLLEPVALKAAPGQRCCALAYSSSNQLLSGLLVGKPAALKACV